MNGRAIVAVMVTGISSSAGLAFAEDMPARPSATVQWMIEQERAWAEQACGKKWVLSELLADDFHGTSPKGARYDKPKEEPAADPATPYSTDCRLDSADVRFFGDSVAVVFGSESRMAALPNSKYERRCLVWTDTWLQRDGKWQIIAVQDTRIDCPAT